MDGLHGTSTSSSPPLHEASLPTLPFQSPKLDLGVEGLGIHKQPKRDFL